MRPPDANRIGAERERLEEGGPPPKSAVEWPRDAPDDHLHHFRERIDGGATAVLAASAMVRHDDPVDAVLDRELGVLRGQNSLEHHLHARRVLEPAHELPAQVRGEHTFQSRKIDPLIIRPGACAPTDAGRVTFAAYAAIDAAQAGEGLLIATGNAIDGHANPRETT